jgi:hypothetical protein
MFFGQGVRSLTELTATHPPLDVRIRHIDPSFDGTFPTLQALEPAEPYGPSWVPESSEAEVEPESVLGLASGFLGMRGASRSWKARAGSVEIPLDPPAVLATVGSPSEEHVAYATDLIAALPRPLVVAAHDPFSARAVIFALLLDPDESIRRRQLRHLADKAEPGTTEDVLRLCPLVDRLSPELHIPLVDLAIPSLRLLSPAQYESFRVQVQPLVAADSRVSLFEFALERMLVRHLDRYFRHVPRPIVRFRSLDPLQGDCAVLLSALTYLGDDDEISDQSAFSRGVERLGLPPGQQPVLLPRDKSTLPAIDQALARLDAASPEIKRRVLDAAVTCVASDGRVTVAEGELLRAIADSLGCPIPPILASRPAVADAIPERSDQPA